MSSLDDNWDTVVDSTSKDHNHADPTNKTENVNHPENTDHQTSQLDCNICFDPANEPVVTKCGHLYCWNCIYEWLHRAGTHDCPVCKSLVREEEVIPIYGRNNADTSENNADIASNNIPQRPRGQHEPAPPRDSSRLHREQQQLNDENFSLFGLYSPLGGFRQINIEDATDYKREVWSKFTLFVGVLILLYLLTLRL